MEALKPLEAFKFHRAHVQHIQQRATTPLVLSESGRGIESIRISCDSPVIQTDLRSISPPAKLFHCAVSPRRRPPRHAPQRLQRPHRPCLDFDKMQQVIIFLLSNRFEINDDFFFFS